MIEIQLADRSIRYPRGVVENVLIRVDKFIVPVDFVVLDMEEGVEIPLILGRPFLATTRALIDVEEGKLTLRIGCEEVTFVMTKPAKQPVPPAQSTCNKIETRSVTHFEVPQNSIEVHNLKREPQIHTPGDEKFHNKTSPTEPRPKKPHWQRKERKPQRKKVVHEPHPKQPPDRPRPEDIFLDFDPTPYRTFEDPIYHPEAVRYASAASRWKPP